MKTKERLHDESIAGKGKFVYLIAGKYAGGDANVEWYDCMNGEKNRSALSFGNLDTCEKKVNLTSSGPASKQGRGLLFDLKSVI